MKHKVSELEGALLDAAVARAQSFEFVLESRATTKGEDNACWLKINGQVYFGRNPYSPSTNWASGGPIIEHERIAVFPTDNGKEWGAEMRQHDEHWIDTNIYECDARGPTPLIAAMRAYVASKFGEEVELP